MKLSGAPGTIVTAEERVRTVNYRAGFGRLGMLVHIFIALADLSLFLPVSSTIPLAPAAVKFDIYECRGNKSGAGRSPAASGTATKISS